MLNFLRHLLTPHHTNNHRAKILHNSSLFLLLIFLLLGSFLINYFQHAAPEVLGVSYSISENDLLSQVNKERQDRGLNALSLNSELDDAARRKAADMYSKNYWAHFAPDGSTSPWQFIRDAGYGYMFAGENLAKGFTDSSSVVTAWMNSPSHRDNILSDKYRDVGFAIVPGTLSGEETVLVVEMFGARQSQTLAAVTKVAAAAPASPSSEIVTEISPTPVPQLVITKEASQTAVITHPKIDASVTSRAASTVGLSFLAFAFVMDLLIVERKKIPRVVGHNLDHVILILLFLLFIVLRNGGVII
jgi:hypothetical protein